MTRSGSDASSVLFQRDFGAPAGTPSPQAREALSKAEERGYARGLADGRSQAKAEADHALAATLNQIGRDAARLLADADAQRAALEQEAVAFAMALANKLGGEAIRRFPMDAIAEVARSAFDHLRGVPHLAVRVNEELVERTDALVRRIARERGFEGRIMTIGDPEIAIGDSRFEWADGGVVRDGASIGEAVAASLLPPGA